MKLTNISLLSNGLEVANLSFRDPASRNPYMVKGVFGLDADDIKSSFYGECTANFTKFNALSLGPREIVMRIALNPQFSMGKTYSDLRDDLYRAIASSRTGLVQLRFNNGLATVAAISGHVSKFEAPHFNKNPEVQITIRCDREQSMLKALEPVEIDPVTLQSSETIVSGMSTAPHGFKFSITFGAIAEVFTIQDCLNAVWGFVVEPGTIGASTGFLIGDRLHFSSEENNKYLYIVREIAAVDETFHLVDKIHPQSKWPVLFPNANDFEFRALDLVAGVVPDTATKLFTWDAFSYYPTYWGV